MLKKFDTAIVEIKEATRLDPQDEEVQYFLGNLYLANKNRDAAVAQQMKIYTLNPELGRRLFQNIYRNKILIAPPSSMGFE